MTALLACMGGDRRIGGIFLRGRRVCAQRFGLVEQAELIGVPCFTLRAEQLATLRAQSFFGQVALRRHETHHATQFVSLLLKCCVLLTNREQRGEFIGGDGDLNRHADWTGMPIDVQLTRKYFRVGCRWTVVMSSPSSNACSSSVVIVTTSVFLSGQVK